MSSFLKAQACASREITHFPSVLAQNYAYIRAVALRELGHVEDAEDVTQIVCMRLESALADFRGTSRLRPWIYRITVNAARDLRRAERRRNRLADEISRHGHWSAPLAEPRLMLAALWRATQELPTRQRDALRLIFQDHLSYAEAARVMDCERNTVVWHVNEARKRLRLLFQ